MCMRVGTRKVSFILIHGISAVFSGIALDVALSSIRNNLTTTQTFFLIKIYLDEMGNHNCNGTIHCITSSSIGVGTFYLSRVFYHTSRLPIFTF